MTAIIHSRGARPALSLPVALYIHVGLGLPCHCLLRHLYIHVGLGLPCHCLLRHLYIHVGLGLPCHCLLRHLFIAGKFVLRLFTRDSEYAACVETDL